jgi:hypothetical protein
LPSDSFVQCMYAFSPLSCVLRAPSISFPLIWPCTNYGVHHYAVFSSLSWSNSYRKTQE